jgi:hypothetical protein
VTPVSQASRLFIPQRCDSTVESARAFAFWVGGGVVVRRFRPSLSLHVLPWYLIAGLFCGVIAWDNQVQAVQSLYSTLRDPDLAALEFIQHSIPFSILSVWLITRHLRRHAWRISRGSAMFQSGQTIA